jgi:U3 small nucleolar RNA-associated protein 3
MGGRKHRRNTAKSGDKAIYKNKSADHPDDRKEDDDDPIYDAVDRFHSDDYLRLDHPVEDDESEEEEDWGEEAVMDFGISKEDSDGEVDSSDDEEEEEVPISDDDDLQEESEQENVRDWGSRKSTYYHGDTADLEIGQDEDDAVLEEAAAKEVLAARFIDMTEEDFVVSSDEDDTPEINDITTSMSQRNLLQLSVKDKRRLLNKHHPEFLPLVTHFSKLIRVYDSQTSKAVNAMFFGEEGTANVSEIFHRACRIHDRRGYQMISFIPESFAEK